MPHPSPPSMQHITTMVWFVNTQWNDPELANANERSRMNAFLQVKLQKKPKDIEEVTDLTEFIGTIPNQTGPLQDLIAQMMDYNRILETFNHRVTIDHSNAKYTACGWPGRIQASVEEAERLVDQCKERYMDDMMSEQERFAQSLNSLEAFASSFVQYEDLAKHCEEAAQKAAECMSRIEGAEEKSRLFNSREALFEKEMTDYEQLSRIKKTFEPYYNLWSTAQAWKTSSLKWLKGSFLEASYIDHDYDY